MRDLAFAQVAHLGQHREVDRCDKLVAGVDARVQAFHDEGEHRCECEAEQRQEADPEAEAPWHRQQVVVDLGGSIRTQGGVGQCRFRLESFVLELLLCRVQFGLESRPLIHQQLEGFGVAIGCCQTQIRVLGVELGQLRRGSVDLGLQFLEPTILVREQISVDHVQERVDERRDAFGGGLRVLVGGGDLDGATHGVGLCRHLLGQVLGVRLPECLRRLLGDGSPGDPKSILFDVAGLARGAVRDHQLADAVRDDVFVGCHGR